MAFKRQLSHITMIDYKAIEVALEMHKNDNPEWQQCISEMHDDDLEDTKQLLDDIVGLIQYQQQFVE